MNKISVVLADCTKNGSDYDLGGLLLGLFITAQAEDLGIPIDQISEEFGERVRVYVSTLETEDARITSVEKALHKAASGDFESAGRLIRQHLLNRTEQALLRSGFNEMQPLVKIGKKFKKTQSTKAKKSRGKLTDEGDTMSDIIRKLAISEKYSEESAKDLWGHMFAKLDELSLNPEEFYGDSKKATYSYDFKSARKQIAFGTFSNNVSRFRKESKK